jgi:apolipoprotein N-acyltransferase
VVDDLVVQGACMLVVPTMDAEDWGAYEHQSLHTRVAPTRAAEYGIPVVRVCSSGVSQIVDCRGRMIASAGFPGQGEMLGGDIWIQGAGRIPLDRYLGWVCLAVTLGILLYAGVRRKRLASLVRRLDAAFRYAAGLRSKSKLDTNRQGSTPLCR